MPRSVNDSQTDLPTNSGAHAEWLPHVDKLIIEMLANRTQPSCIQANMFAMSHTLQPEQDIVKELPSLKYIKNLCTVLLYITKALTVYWLAHVKEWKQLHTDEMSRCQVSIVNVVISILCGDNELKTICMSGSIISKDGTADEQSHTIIGAFNKSGCLLEEWRDMTATMYPDAIELLESIPNGNAMSPTKLIGGYISHDNCATANKSENLLMENILALGREKGMSNSYLILFQAHCFNHLWNTWFKAIESYLSRKVTEYVKRDLKLIPLHLRVSCKISDLLCQVDRNKVLRPITSKEAVITTHGRSAIVLANNICHPFVYLGAIDTMRHLKERYQCMMDVAIC